MKPLSKKENHNRLKYNAPTCSKSVLRSHHMTDLIFIGTPAGVILGYEAGKCVWL